MDDTAILAERVGWEGIGNDVLELTEYMNRYNPKGACFMAGTLVATKTGKKAIEKIEEGEEVWCEEENTGEWKIKRVLNCIEKTSDILYHIHIGNQEIQATEEHPIWLEGKGWKKAEDIHIGDKVRCRNGELEEITNIWMEKLPEQVKVYNLSVEDCHTYYVTEKEVLVHNTCSKGNRVNIESVVERGRNSRESILPKENSHNAARNTLLKELDKTGAFKNGSNKYIGRLDSSFGYGKQIGRQSFDGKVRWRLDFDEKIGVHYNFEDFSKGKGAKAVKKVIPIDMSYDEYKKMLDLWN